MTFLFFAKAISVNSKIMKSAGFYAAAALGVMLMGGCASQGHSSVADSGSGSNQLCSYNRGIGSHIGSRQCMSRGAYEKKQAAEHKQAQKNADTGEGAGTGGGRL